MKAEIDEKGKLTVSPETALEAYALRHWYINFQTGDKSSTLGVETTIVEKKE